MKKYISILIGLFLFSLSCSLNGQSEERMKIAIIGLQQTTFTQQYMQQKEFIENEVESFFQRKELYSEEDIKRIQVRYEESKEEYDELLNMVKKDFTDSKKQKEIFNKPDQFARENQDELEEVWQNYQSNCQKEMDLLDPRGASIVDDIRAVFEIVGELLNISKKSQKAFKRMSEEYFEEHYASKLRLKAWEKY